MEITLVQRKFKDGTSVSVDELVPPVLDGRIRFIINTFDKAGKLTYTNGYTNEAGCFKGYSDIVEAHGEKLASNDDPYKKRPECSSCRSDQVTLDASAIWDHDKQFWVLFNAFDQAYCEKCGGQTTLDWRTINWEDEK